MEIHHAQRAAEEQQADPLFVCTACGEPVLVFNGAYFRTCDHSEAPVAATYAGMRVASNAV